MNLLDDGFGDWLAGFIDGEGCFSIPLNLSKLAFSCRCAIQLRIDDAPILREIHDRTGIGSLYYQSPAALKRDGRPSNPLAVWVVATKPSVLALVQILDQHKLRAKKTRDYAVWREAVFLWQKIRRGNLRQNWPAAVALHEQLSSARQFDAQEEFIPDSVEPPQLVLIQEANV